MPKVLTARGSDGLVAIHEPDANLDTPVGNLNKIYFHSALNYLSINFYRDVVIDAATQGVTALFAHGKSRPVMFLPIRLDTNDPMGGTCVIRAANRLYQCITFYSDNTNICVRGHGNDTRSTPLTIRVYIFDNQVF